MTQHTSAKYRVAVLQSSTDGSYTKLPTYYWADSGCGELTLERAQQVCAAGRANGERCKIVLADEPILKAAP